MHSFHSQTKVLTWVFTRHPFSRLVSVYNYLDTSMILAKAKIIADYEWLSQVFGDDK